MTPASPTAISSSARASIPISNISPSMLPTTPRSTPAARRRRRSQGRAGRDGARRRGARHGRRHQLCEQPVQPRGPGPAPAGSAFKLFVYLAALENGLTPDDIGASTSRSPSRAGARRTSEDLSRRGDPARGLIHSINTVAGRSPEGRHRQGGRGRASAGHHRADAAGAEPGARRHGGDAAGADRCLCGDRQPGQGRLALHHHPDHATAYGRVLYQRRRAGARAGSRARRSGEMVDMLQAMVAGGTGTAAQLDRPAAGKTGTSQDYRDAWFVGFTPRWSPGSGSATTTARP